MNRLLAAVGEPFPIGTRVTYSKAPGSVFTVMGSVKHPTRGYMAQLRRVGETHHVADRWLAISVLEEVAP